MKFFKAQIICFFLIFISFSGHAQDNSWRTYQKNKDVKQSSIEDENDTLIPLNDTIKRELNYNGEKGTIMIYQDTKIDSLTNRIGRKPFINGYTLQIEVSQQKAIIKNARYMFLKYNPDVPLDEDYDQPNTYLFAGRFYDKDSAYEFKHKIRSNFPNAIVIQKKLNLPSLRPK